MTTPTHLVIEPSDKKEKRLKATYFFRDGRKTKTIHFGSPPAFTFFDGADERKRENYIKRHSKNEDWNDIYSAGFMARFVLWERKSSVKGILSRKTGIPEKNVVLRNTIVKNKK